MIRFGIALLVAALASPAAADTDLHSAAYDGDAVTVSALLAAGADPNARDSKGITPLHHAAGQGHTAALTALLEAGADPDACAGPGRTSLFTPLHSAVGAGIVPATAGEGHTVALGEGHTAALLSLLEAGADPNPCDSDAGALLALTTLIFAAEQAGHSWDALHLTIGMPRFSTAYDYRRLLNRDAAEVRALLALLALLAAESETPP